jgi:hypothetical protein
MIVTHSGLRAILIGLLFIGTIPLALLISWAVVRFPDRRS